MNSKNRILHIPRRFLREEWGGTETSVLELAKHQLREGFRPEVFTSMALASKREEVLEGIPVRRFSHFYPYFGLSSDDRLAMDKKGGNLVSLSMFAAMMRVPDVRIFHSYAMKRLGGEIRTAARLRKIPYVVSLPGGLFDVPRGERDLLMKPAEGKVEWGQPFGFLFGSRRVLDDADHIICVGESEREKLVQNVRHGRVSYLPNGVDLDKFRSGDGGGFRQKNGIPSDAFLILNISRIDAQKNQLALLEAFARMRADRAHARLLLIGPVTQPDYARKLEAFVKDHQLSEYVQILPGMGHDHPDLVNAYHACDVFVLPSVHEPFGIVVLEAWSACKAAIVSRVGGLKGFVAHEETGLFFDPNASDATLQLFHSLQRCASDPVLRHQLGENGRAEVMAKYQWKAVGAQLEVIYASAEEHVRKNGKSA